MPWAVELLEGVPLLGTELHIAGRESLGEVLGLVTPMIGAVTAGWPATQASAIWARDTPRPRAMSPTRSTMTRSLSWYSELTYRSAPPRRVSRSQGRVSLPRASGLHGMTPTPWSAQSGSISRSSSRYSRLKWFCIDTKEVQPCTWAAC